MFILDERKTKFFLETIKILIILRKLLKIKYEKIQKNEKTIKENIKNIMKKCI